MQGNDFVTTASAAKRLGVDRTTVTRLAASGDLPIAMKAPGRNGALFFQTSDIEALAASRATEPASS